MLSQIGLGYTFLFLLWGRPRWLQWSAVVLILVGYWYFFYQHPLPDPDFDYATVGVASDWPHLEGIAAHWDKNTNAAAAFDHWFLNLFPRSKEFVYNGGGYLTLELHSVAGHDDLWPVGGRAVAQSAQRPRESSGRWSWPAWSAWSPARFCDMTGVCPIVKRIWTPSWTLFSTGWACLILAAFYGVVDMLKFRRWTFPLVVVGMNSITMYCMAELIPGWIHRTLRTHFGARIFEFVDKPYQPLLGQRVDPADDVADLLLAVPAEDFHSDLGHGCAALLLIARLGSANRLGR